MKNLLLLLTLFGLLAAAVAVATHVWIGMSDVALSTHGVIALALGVLASLALGTGLMALVFYSHRKGHDDIHRGDIDRGEIDRRDKDRHDAGPARDDRHG